MTLLSQCAWLAGILLAAGMILAFIRLAKGPTLPDRVVALDALATMSVGALILIAVATGQALLIDVALAIALITFLGTIAFAISLDRGIQK